MSTSTNTAREVSTDEFATAVPALSTSRMVVLTIIAAVVVFAISAALDAVLLHEGDSRLTAVEVSDVIGAGIAGVLVFRLLQYERDRRNRLRKKIAVIADMNHHVRNALQVISFHAYSSTDKQQLAAVQESMERIQWALKEVLPKL